MHLYALFVGYGNQSGQRILVSKTALTLGDDGFCREPGARAMPDARDVDIESGATNPLYSATSPFFSRPSCSLVKNCSCFNHPAIFIFNNHSAKRLPRLVIIENFLRRQSLAEKGDFVEIRIGPTILP